MSWFGKFAFGAASGLFLSAAIGVPVVHYAENGGMAAVSADIDYVSASIKNKLAYKPEDAELSAEAREIRKEVENSRSQLIPSKEDFAVIGDTIEQATGITDLASSPNPLATLFQQGFKRRCSQSALEELSAREKIRRRSACEQAEKFTDGDMAWAENTNQMSEDDAALVAAIQGNDLAKIREICRKPLTRYVNGQQSLRDKICKAMLSPNR